MDSLKTLFDKKQFELILELTKTSEDESGLFYRLSSLVSLGKLNEALVLIENNRQIFEKRMFDLMNLHFEILFELNEYDKAYDELIHYQNTNYVSQECEEFLSSLPKLIRQKEREHSLKKNVSVDDLKTTLISSKDNYEILSALDKIKSLKIDDFIDQLKILCSEKVRKLHIYVKTYALMMLVNIKLNDEILYINREKEEKLNPSKLHIPFEGTDYQNFLKKVNLICKNPTISNSCISLFGEYQMSIYPRNPFEENELDKMISGLIFISNNLFGEDNKNNEIFSLLNTNYLEAEKMGNAILSSINSIEELKI